MNAVAPQLLDTPANRVTFPDEAMAHAVAPEAIAGLIAFLVSDAVAPVSGAILPAYGANEADTARRTTRSDISVDQHPPARRRRHCRCRS